MPEEIKKASQPDTLETLTGGNPAAAVMAGVTPDSTTAALVADVPKASESQKATTSSAAPESSETKLAKDAPLESNGAVPGTFPETPAKETEQLSVNPTAASSGLGKPEEPKPGESAPDSSTCDPKTVESANTTDKEGYEKNAIYPEVPGLGPEASKPVQAFAVPPVDETLIPESSLPLNPAVCDTNDPVTIQSAAPEATTAVLAAQVLKESEKKKTNGDAPADEVPDVVKQSISEARKDPEAAANEKAVEEKKTVEEELQKKVVPEEEAPPTASEVPGVVKESLKKAREEPEAAANSEAVEEKKEVEDQLQNTVPITESAGEPAPTTTAETTLTAPAATNESAEVSPTTTPAPPSEPIVTSGIREAKTEEVSTPENQQASAPADSTTPDTKDKKKKSRTSGFFNKLKEIFR